MKQNNHFPAGFTRRQTVLAMLSAVGLSACGGGGDDMAGVGVGGTGSFTVGRVSGFGSFIVNRVRFDNSTALVIDMDGNRVTPDQLKLGMVVAVTGSAIMVGVAGGLSTATATTVRYGNELEGPVSSAESSSLVVLGQTVRVDANTILDLGNRSLSSLTLIDVVEVYGFLNPRINEIVATRIELEDDPVSQYYIQGLVASLNETTRQFRIGTLQISYANTEVPINLADGQLVSVKLAITPNGNVWTATRVRTTDRQVDDVNQAEIEGLVTTFTDTTTFSVNGIPVNAIGARVENGPVALNRRVEVEGRIENGVLIAREVEIDTDDQDEFDLTGSISGLDTTNKTFVVRGVTVDYNGMVRFDDGNEAMLANGRVVEVYGTYNALTNRIAATEIDFSTS